MMTAKERLHIVLEQCELDYDAIDRVLGRDDFSDMDFDELANALRDEEAFIYEFIYYSDARDFLWKHDSSLSESLEIADELGYHPKDIDICLLACLLQERHSEDEFYEHREQIERLMDEIRDESIED